jgi:hypothetical protein
MIRRIVAGALTAALLVAVGCSTPTSKGEVAARCSLNSDCRSPLVCSFERCHEQCTSSRDCKGKLCVRGEKGVNVCQLDDEIACIHNSDCPGTQLCGRDQKCHDVCITDKDCVVDLLCVTRLCAKADELVDGGDLPSKLPEDAGAQCLYNTDCPGELICLNGHCDAECVGNKDCEIGWTCNLEINGGDGRCYPLDRDAGVRDGGNAVDAGSDAGTMSDASTDAGDAGDGGR